MKIEKIAKIFKNKEAYISGWKKMKRASVLIPLIEIQGKTYILFEVRAKKNISQPGDICFPGGRIDKNETPSKAAIRETEEELGIKKENIKIINELDTLIRLDGIIIHSFLAKISNIKDIIINTEEVDSFFIVPLDYLIKYKPLVVQNKVITERGKDFPYELILGGENYKFKTGTSQSLFYKYEDYVIWGITAEILYNFLQELN